MPPRAETALAPDRPIKGSDPVDVVGQARVQADRQEIPGLTDEAAMLGFIPAIVGGQPAEVGWLKPGRRSSFGFTNFTPYIEVSAARYEDIVVVEGNLTVRVRDAQGELKRTVYAQESGQLSLSFAAGDTLRFNGPSQGVCWFVRFVTEAESA